MKYIAARLTALSAQGPATMAKFVSKTEKMRGKMAKPRRLARMTCKMTLA
jgi:hypothetical protein